MNPSAQDLWFLPLGGCGEIGINMNLYGHDGRWLLVDCGIGFDRESTTTRIFAPDPTFIEERRDRLEALLVTHAHEDHVGAVAELWPQLRCPVFCTGFTAAILQGKLEEAGLSGTVPVTVIAPGTRHLPGRFDIEWLGLTHSTPESQGLVIRTPAGTVFHTGDWKLDPRPVVGADYDRSDYEALAREGVLAMVCDSTNATVPGRSVSEGSLESALFDKVSAARGRVVVACFGSNIARLATLRRVAARSGRYAALLGRSLERYYRAARATGLWPGEQGFIDSSHIGYLPPEEVFLVATGSQGEPNAALSRLAQGSHPALDLEPGDTVIFSARAIPGNEESLERLYLNLRDRGVEVVVDDDDQPIHASGHPAQEELADMYRWVQPKVAIPVHGEPHHLEAHADLARSSGVPLQLRGRNGDLFMLAPQPGVRRGFAATGRIPVRR